MWRLSGVDDDDDDDDDGPSYERFSPVLGVRSIGAMVAVQAVRCAPVSWVAVSGSKSPSSSGCSTFTVAAKIFAGLSVKADQIMVILTHKIDHGVSALTHQHPMCCCFEKHTHVN
jgi:hypothetical protein